MTDLPLSELSPLDTDEPRSEERALSKRRRRFFEAAEKLRIVQEAAELSKRGDLAELLQRESIYSSLLSAWRKAYRLHGAAGLEAAKPGRKPKGDWRDRRIRELESRIHHLESELQRICGSSAPIAEG